MWQCGWAAGKHHITVSSLLLILSVSVPGLGETASKDRYVGNELCAQCRMLSRVASVHQGSRVSSTGAPTSLRSAARLSSVIFENRGVGSAAMRSLRI